ncbi:hypothetical protein TNCV_993361 [Trichonephila clavipes]|nr:hypothetical protein TNCV_993361 [Trichonephila clavipes]
MGTSLCLESRVTALLESRPKLREIVAQPVPALKGPAKIAYSDADKNCTHHVVQNNILIPEQHGFRPDLSTTTPTPKSSGNDKVRIQNKKIDCTDTGSLRSRTRRRYPHRDRSHHINATTNQKAPSRNTGGRNHSLHTQHRHEKLPPHWTGNQPS